MRPHRDRVRWRPGPLDEARLSAVAFWTTMKLKKRRSGIHRHEGSARDGLKWAGSDKTAGKAHRRWRHVPVDTITSVHFRMQHSYVHNSRENQQKRTLAHMHRTSKHLLEYLIVQIMNKISCLIFAYRPQKGQKLDND